MGGYLSPQERQERVRRIDELKQSLQNIPRSPYATVRGLDTTALKKRISVEEQRLHAGIPPNLSPIQKNRLYKRAKELRDEIRGSLQSKTTMMGKRVMVGKNSYARIPEEGAVLLEVKRMEMMQAKDREFKEIMRTLDHDDPNITNLEKIRRGRG